MSEYYTVKEVSKRTGISEHTLRYYDKEGLLSFIKRDKNGVRLFTKEDFEHLYTITVLKKTGMSLKTIKEFMDLYMQGNNTIHDRYLIYAHQKEVLQKKIDELQEMVDFIDNKCHFFEEAEKYGDIEYYKKLPEDQIDKRILEYNKDVNDFFEGKKKVNI